jgi:hypothetical protein
MKRGLAAEDTPRFRAPRKGLDQKACMAMCVFGLADFLSHFLP